MTKLRESTDAETVSISETSRMLGIGINQTYEAAKAGDIPAIRVGGRWLVLKAPLYKMLGVEAA